VWLVLTHAGDESALWVYDRLRARSRGDARILFVEELDAATTWTHDVGRGGAHTDVRLADGRRLETTGHGAVLNRLPRPPFALLSAGAPADATYASSEMHAFAMSWIRSLAPVVVNGPTAQGLSGRWRPALHWRALGTRAGLPVVPLHLASADPPLDGGADPGCDPGDDRSSVVLVLGGELVGRCAPLEVRRAARRLAALADTALLGLRFSGPDPADAGWRLLDATPLPDLRIAGEPGVAALEALAS